MARRSIAVKRLEEDRRTTGGGQITLRVGQEILAFLEAEGRRLEALFPGLEPTPSDIVRMAIRAMMAARAKENE